MLRSHTIHAGFSSIALAALLTAAAEPEILDRGPYQISIRSSPAPRDGASPTVALLITDKRTGQSAAANIGNYTKSVSEVFVAEQDKLVLIGEPDFSGHAISIINPANGKLLDTIYTWELAVSRANRYVAYEYRYPPYGLPQFRNSVLLLYDFRSSPDLIPHVQGDNAEKGFILYPEQNRIANRYVLPSPHPPETRNYSSPIEWSQSGTSVGVLESFEGDTDFVLVNLKDGPRNPKVTTWKLNKLLFLNPSSEKPKDGRVSVPLSATELTFVDHDSAVIITSSAGGPFAQTKVRLSLADGAQTAEEPAVQAKHLEIPLQTKYIRVGEEVEEGALLNKEPSPLTWRGENATVRFEALVGIDGRVEKLLPIAGPAALIPIAERAVRNRLYAQTVLNGERVAVLTTIAIVLCSRAKARENAESGLRHYDGVTVLQVLSDSLKARRGLIWSYRDVLCDGKRNMQFDVVDEGS